MLIIFVSLFVVHRKKLLDVEYSFVAAVNLYARDIFAHCCFFREQISFPAPHQRKDVCFYFVIDLLMLLGFDLLGLKLLCHTVLCIATANFDEVCTQCLQVSGRQIQRFLKSCLQFFLQGILG